MKLISWNVNGLRACLTKGFAEYFDTVNADFFCLQETKMEQGQADFTPAGYLQFWNSAVKKGYSGTAIFTRREPLSVRYGMGIPQHDQEGRIIVLEYEAFFLVTVYTPNSQRELLRLDYRMTWEDDFANFLIELDREKPVIVCGDMNVAHKEIDIRHPKANVKNAGFTPQEREKMTALLERGFVDTFRHLHPDEPDRYTWWSYMANARAKNVGWRIDYFLVSQRLTDKISLADIDADTWGSDHCPVLLELEEEA
jgi:exodeoxyribonuclease-3